MNWFMHHPVLLGLVGAGVAVAYGLYLTWWLLKQPAGNERMREISAAVQEGAAAYLTQAVHDDRDRRGRAVHPARRLQQARLGDGVRVPRRSGAFGGRRVHRDERRRALELAHRRGCPRGLKPALNVAFKAGSVTGLLVVGLGLFGVTGYYWFLTGALHNSPTRRSTTSSASRSAAR